MNNKEILSNAYWALSKATNLLMDEYTYKELDAEWLALIYATSLHFKFFYDRYKLHQQETSK